MPNPKVSPANFPLLIPTAAGICGIINVPIKQETFFGFHDSLLTLSGFFFPPDWNFPYIIEHVVLLVLFNLCKAQKLLSLLVETI